MRPQILSPPVVKGERADNALGKEHRIKALFVIQANPGIGVTQIAKAVGAHPGTGRVIADHFASLGIVRVEPREGRESTGCFLTPLGERIVEHLLPIVEDDLPDIDPSIPGQDPRRAHRHVLDDPKAKALLVFLSEHGPASLPEWVNALPSKSAYEGQYYRHALELVDLVQPAVKKGNPALALSPRGTKVAKRLAGAEALLREVNEIVVKDQQS
jgi:hypothetical protein